MTTALLASLETAHRALAECDERDERGSLHAVSDELLLQALERAAAVRRLVDARSAMLAGEVAERSTPQLGHSGLAQRHGHRTPEELVRVTTGSSRHDARVAVRAGTMLLGASGAGVAEVGGAEPDGAAGSGIDGAGVEGVGTDGAGINGAGIDGAGINGAGGSQPGALGGTQRVETPLWAHALITPVTRGEMSTAALEAIRSGLGDTSETVSFDDLSAAVSTLIAESATLDVDRLFRRARQMRDNLDTAGVAERERARREARSLRIFRGNDGMTRATWLLDPESAAIVIDLYDRATSPRRGGPTFLSARDASLIDRMRADERTPEQYASDAFLDLLRTGADTDSNALLSSGAPSVRVVVTAHDLHEGVGHARIDGQVEPISLPTVQRMICAGTHTPVFVGSTGQPLDVGRSQRLFTPRQRIALATRDGGCRWAGCDRPPSWTEAHHITPWADSGGRTDVADGILLCRHHHLLVHNNGWRIERHRAPDGLDEYRAIPPAAGAAAAAVAVAGADAGTSAGPGGGAARAGGSAGSGGAGRRPGPDPGTTEPINLPAHDDTIRRALRPRRAA